MVDLGISTEVVYKNKSRRACEVRSQFRDMYSPTSFKGLRGVGHFDPDARAKPGLSRGQTAAFRCYKKCSLLTNGAALGRREKLPVFH